MTVHDLPIRSVDLIGSILMIVFSFLCVRTAYQITKNQPDSVIWIYLFWVCCGFAIFAISRSAGHILKQVLLLTGHDGLWESIRPFSGAVNTLAFLLVASITLFFERTWRVYQEMSQSQKDLRMAHRDLVYMNQNLEQLVEERTQALAQTEKQIAQAEKLASIGQLSSGIAHEINNPLGIILGYTQLLLRQEVEDSERYTDLKTIEKHVKNCKAIVENLLNFARSSKSKTGPVSIKELVDDVVQFVGRQSERDGITFEVCHDPDIPVMNLDEKKIKQVLINLLMNARQAIDSNGIINVSTWYDASTRQATIQVQDTGNGIDAENLSRIFDPFFTTKPTGKGTGLGLSVSYGIIKDHGGRITVESEKGKGATFTVELPEIFPENKVKP